MAWHLFAGLVVLVSVPCLAAAEVDLTQPLPVDKDTISLYHLDDVATGQVQDATGGRPGSAENAVPAIGRFGGALSCAETGGWVDITGLPDEAPKDGITVECWVKFPTSAGGDIICRNMSYMIRIGSTVSAYFAIDGSWRPVSGIMPVPVGRWTHLAITYDRASKEVRIYIDGKLDVATVPRGITDGVLEAGETTLRLGANTWNPSIMNGKLDELRVSSVARTYRPLYPETAPPVARDTNLLANPSFESGMYGWRITSEGNGLRRWQIERGDAAQGRAYLHAAEPTAHTLISYPFVVPRGETVSVSAAMKADHPCRGQLTLHCTAGRGRGSALGGTFNVTEAWQRFSAPLSIPEDWPADTAYLEVGAREDALIDVDAISVVAGEQTNYTQTVGQSIGLDAELPPENTYMLGQAAPLSVAVTNTGDQGRDLTLECTVTDRLGREAGAQQVRVGTVAPGQTTQARVDLPDTQVGWFLAHFAVRQGGRVIEEADRIFNVIEPLQGAGGILDAPLGMNTHMERETTADLTDSMNTLARCGVKWIRAWWGWGMAEKEPGQFDWTEYDRQLNVVQQAGMEIMPILLRYYPAYEQAWSGGLERIQRPPYDLEKWGNYVRTTAEHYRGKVKAWEVWNEPWDGLDADYYAKLLKVTYDSIRAVDPDVTIVGYGGSGPSYIRKGFEAGSVKCMDVISVHSYAELSRPFERMKELEEAVLSLAAEYGAPERIWHTEQGSGADGMHYRASSQTEAECAVNLVQGYLSALSTGAEKFFWFSAQTTPTYGWGVYYENYIPRPRLIAINGLARVLQGRRITGRADLADGQVACVLMDGEAGAAAALWNLDDAMSIRLPAGTAAAWTDMLCNPMKVDPDEAVELTHGQPVYVLTPGSGADRLADALRRAEVTLLAPVGITFAPAADGKLQMTLTGESPRNADLRLTVHAPDLFTADAGPIGIADLGPNERRTASLVLDKTPAAGTEVPVTVTVEFGSHEIRTVTVRQTVRF